eukprot:6303921-Karenia_brevis.AAC.1
MAAPGQRQLKSLPQLLYKSFLIPVLESVQMGSELLEYTKPRGSGNFEHRIKLDDTWQVILQGKEIEIPSSHLKCMAIKLR